MGKKWRNIRIFLYVHIRLLRLYFVKMQEPENAKTAEEMLREIKEKLQERITADSSGCCDIRDKK